MLIDDLLGERQVVLALEVLADLADVQLRAVLRVVAVKELQESLVCSLTFFCAGRGVLGSVACRFERGTQTSEIVLFYFFFGGIGKNAPFFKTNSLKCPQNF